MVENKNNNSQIGCMFNDITWKLNVNKDNFWPRFQHIHIYIFAKLGENERGGNDKNDIGVGEGGI